MLALPMTISRSKTAIFQLKTLAEQSASVLLWSPIYTGGMMDEQRFRNESEKALEALKQRLIAAEEDGEFEAEEQGGVLNVLFEEAGGKFVFTPNTPVRQIWISALSTSFKLDWDEARGTFVLPKTGEDLVSLTQRLLREHTGNADISL